MKSKPLSIENRWDILYRYYPEVYDEFANVPYKPNMISVLNDKFDFNGRTIVDIGSGSGRSSIELARYAKQVIGFEPEEAMRQGAYKNTRELGLQNIVYEEGRAENMPLDDGSVDIVAAFWATMYPPEEVIPLFVDEAKRVVKPGGLIFSVDVAPGWYGGELAQIIDDPEADIDSQTKHRLFVDEKGFTFTDLYQTSYYGSLEKIIRTYGFIFGSKVIEYIKENSITSIKWKFRVYYARAD